MKAKTVGHKHFEVPLRTFFGVLTGDELLLTDAEGTAELVKYVLAEFHDRLTPKVRMEVARARLVGAFPFFNQPSEMDPICARLAAIRKLPPENTQEALKAALGEWQETYGRRFIIPDPCADIDPPDSALEWFGRD